MVRAKKRFLDMMNLKKQLRRLVIPIFVELALVMMLGATDTIMLSLSLIHISEPTRRSV